MAEISIWVKPGAGANRVGWDPWRKRWNVACRAAATHGEANRAVVQLMADWLGVPPSSVHWKIAGASRAKLLEVDGMTDSEAADQLRRRASIPPLPGAPDGN
ncbi:MAG: DUF167 domain-containing protein [Thermoplasmata archaeon]|nr:DUF167 domain-containing protein [Thermoplasmata archaeon]